MLASQAASVFSAEGYLTLSATRWIRCGEPISQLNRAFSARRRLWR
jgi:hypothetical protein